MKTNIIYKPIEIQPVHKGLLEYENAVYTRIIDKQNWHHEKTDHSGKLAEILVITSYPPRECGIATYSQDLIKALNKKFSKSVSIKVCALETASQHYEYPEEVKY